MLRLKTRMVSRQNATNSEPHLQDWLSVVEDHASPDVVVMILGGFFTVFSMSKIWIKGFWGADSGHSDLAPSLPFLSLLACILLSTLTLTIGLFPDFLFEKAQLASHQLTGVLTLAD